MLTASIAGGTVEIVECAKPELAEGEILVMMKACGVCGTDIEKVAGHYTASALVIGHEAVGEVVESKTPQFKPGDRVFPHHHVPCYSCWFCRHGSTTMCESYRRYNLEPGGFSEFFRVPKWNVKHGGVVKLPDSLSYDAGSFIEPLACVVRSLRKCNPATDSRILVVGAGPMGLLHALLLRKRRTCGVSIKDVSELRASYARSLGFKTDNEAKDYDLVIVASGHPSAISAGFRSVRRGGRVCIFGVPYKGNLLDIETAELLNSEISIITSYGADDADVAEAIRSMNEGDALGVERLISERFRLEDTARALKAAATGNAIKVLVTADSAN